MPNACSALVNLLRFPSIADKGRNSRCLGMRCTRRSRRTSNRRTSVACSDTANRRSCRGTLGQPGCSSYMARLARRGDRLRAAGNCSCSPTTTRCSPRVHLAPLSKPRRRRAGLPFDAYPLCLSFLGRPWLVTDESGLRRPAASQTAFAAAGCELGGPRCNRQTPWSHSRRSGTDCQAVRSNRRGDCTSRSTVAGRCATRSSTILHRSPSNQVRRCFGKHGPTH